MAEVLRLVLVLALVLVLLGVRSVALLLVLRLRYVIGLKVEVEVGAGEGLVREGGDGRVEGDRAGDGLAILQLVAGVDVLPQVRLFRVAGHFLLAGGASW